MKRIHGATISTIVTALLVALAPGAARADTVVQIPLPGVLDTRSVFTLTNGTIVPFTLAIDGGNGDVGTGAQNGFATKAVAMMKSPGNVMNSLPDDGHFPADTNHPEVVLNFSNAADATSPQNHLVKPPIAPTTPGSSFSFPVPSATYSKLLLFFHGANGGTMVKITLTYSDATTDVTSAMIPDFFNAPTDAKVFVLAPDLAKWTKTTTIAEANHHNIFGITVAPMAKTLSMVKVERGMTGFLVFWGATGVATSAVMGLPDAGAGTDAGTAADAAGTAGTSGAGGAATGAAGAGGAGGAGTSGGAGANGVAGTSGGGGQTAGSTGTSGMTGAGTAGAAGSTTTTGTAGTGVTVPKAKSSGGCSVAVGEPGGGSSRASWLMLGIAGATWVARKRRRAPRSRR